MRHWSTFESLDSHQLGDPVVDSTPCASDEIWTPKHIESWSRDTLRLANATAIEAMNAQESKEHCLDERERVIQEEWENAKSFIPVALRAELRQMLLDAPV